MAPTSPSTTPPQSVAAPPAAPAPNADPSFYMRELPKEKLVSYDSPEGKALFKAALEEGGLEAFFPLSQQFLTQNEPAYCGIGTLCMILNALKIDPGNTWRKPWRWFTQEMLDCCRPLEYVKKNGITLAEFSCLAKCNGLEATTRFADQTAFEEFEQAVKKCTFSADSLLAISYSRAALGQTGSGHFSPVGGYTSQKGGMVLVLDVARFKYPSYWVPIRDLFQALIPKDPATGQARGYSILRAPTTKPQAALLTLNAAIPTWPTLYSPLADIAASAKDYPGLVSALSDTLRAPSGLPAVVSRVEGPSISKLTVLSKTPGFDAAAGAKAHGEYRRGIARLYRYFAEHSGVYKELETVDDMWRTEITVFVLALLSANDIQQRMLPAVREEVAKRIEGDLQQEMIAAEVAAVRKQVESLTDCTVSCGSGGCGKCSK